MTSAVFKISFYIGVAVSVTIILLEVCNMLVLYKHLSTDLYTMVVAILFLSAGILISNYQSSIKRETASACDGPVQLTIKELSVLKMIIHGKSNKEIAAENFVELSTIKTHINNIYNKLGIKNRREAIRKFAGKI